MAIEGLVADASALVLAVTDRTRRGSGALARLHEATVHGWHRCPSVIDHDPQPGTDWATGCNALAASDTLVAEYNKTWEGDCGAWADTQQTRMAKVVPEWLRAPDCERAAKLSYLWIQAHHGDDAPSGVSRC